MNFTSQIETFFLQIKNKFTALQITAFVAAMIAGLVAHGYVIFNRISYHDNSACLFSLGGTYESGRWLLGFIYDLQMKTTKLFAVPVFNGILSIVIIAFAAMLMVDIFKLKSKTSAIYVGIIMVVYPVVTSIFSFMFTSWEYFLALMLSILAAKLLVQIEGVKGFVLSAIVLALSLGIYQAFFAVTIAILLSVMLVKVIDGTTTSVSGYVTEGVTDLGVLASGLIIWALMKKITQTIKGIDAVVYKGMDEGYNLALFPKRLLISLQEFFGFFQEGINSVAYLRLLSQIIVIVAMAQLVGLLIWSKNKKSVKLVSIVGIVLLPIAMNVVYLLSTSAEYHVDTLMLYGDIFIFILPSVFIQHLEELDIKPGFGFNMISTLTKVQIIFIAIMIIGYTYMDNAAYMKAELAEEQATSYYIELVSNIKATEGFDEDMDIIFVGWNYLDDATNVKLDKLDQLEAVKLEKFPRFTDIITYGGSIYFMQEHLGFGNEHLIEDDGTVAAEPVVQAMPTYPNDGAIAVVDGRLIVKLGEE